MSSPSDPSAGQEHPEPGRLTAAVPLPRVLDLLPLGAALLDADGRIAYGNPVLAGALQVSAADLAGRDWFRELVPSLDETGTGPRYRAEVATGAMHLEADFALPGPQGDRSLHAWLCSVPTELGAWGLLVMDDRTPLAQERERRERAERLASVGELAAGVAHEVNNPLASIKSFAQLLARDATGAEQREALALIISESTRVAGIVENLLSFARQQGAGGRERVNLSELSERVLQMQRYSLKTAGITVRRDFDAALSSVMGERGALQQVILNLVVNAEHALSTKQGDRLLIIRTRESTEGVILSVVDNGPGIPRELLPHIFDRFRTTKPGGTGLGLAISAAIVRDHAGQIWAESDEGRGAAFFVQLPRAPAALQPTETVEEPQPEPAAPLRPLRILVADDEPSLRTAISLFLTRRGHMVVQASDAYEAIRLVEEQRFDVALVDARMPGDGLALLEHLEEIPWLRGRTALMTGDIGRARTQQGIATGRPYLAKPFDMDEMVALLESLAG